VSGGAAGRCQREGSSWSSIRRGSVRKRLVALGTAKANNPLAPQSPSRPSTPGRSRPPPPPLPSTATPRSLARTESTLSISTSRSGLARADSLTSLAAVGAAETPGGSSWQVGGVGADDEKAMDELVARVLEAAPLRSAPKFFAAPVQGDQDAALLFCAARGQPVHIPALLAAGASASARSGNKLAHTLLLERDELWLSGGQQGAGGLPASAAAAEALHALLAADFSFDASARKLLQRAGDRLAAVAATVDKLSDPAANWRCGRSGGTVLHCLLDAAVAGAIDPLTALHLCTRALPVDWSAGGHGWVDERDRAGRTARAIAEQLAPPCVDTHTHTHTHTILLPLLHVFVPLTLRCSPALALPPRPEYFISRHNNDNRPH
jgi:hypothetical protein